MQVNHIPLARTGQMHPLTQAYLTQNKDLQNYYQWPFSPEGFAQAIAARKKIATDRHTLAAVLRRQYNAHLPLADSAEVASHIDLLERENTFTVTTGHQLNIFTGPLYFIYKIASAIKLARQLKEKFPEENFVPVYWMASEDHDLEEINHLHLWGRTLTWGHDKGSAVGRMDTQGLKELADEINALLGERPHAAELHKLLEQYAAEPVLSQACRRLVHSLFGRYGVVVIDADAPELKKALIPVIRKDLTEHTFYHEVTATASRLGNDYKLPVTAREINFFYLSENSRDRIVREEDTYTVLGQDIEWELPQLMAEVEKRPERFSPNVVLRPVYQEIILPNIAYIGGNNEIAYWMELKSAFAAAEVFFPMLVVRDSVLWIGKRSAKDMAQLNLKEDDLFLKQDELKQRYYEAQELEHPAEARAGELLQLMETFRGDLQGLDNGFVAGVVKQLNQQQKDVKKWKADIRKKQLESEDKNLQKLDKLYNTVYPNGSFQERYENFIPYYLVYGPQFMAMLVEYADPLAAQLHIISED